LQQPGAHLFSYRLVDSIAWVKKTSTGKLRANIGYHLRHAKELCLVALKGEAHEDAKRRTYVDVVVDEIGLHSQKPAKVYEIAEGLCPDGPYLELFGRRHNMRPGWVTVGNQISEEEYTKGLKRLRPRKRKIPGPKGEDKHETDFEKVLDIGQTLQESQANI
jgi:N6-adenosine-specific RNA methylase IME4